MSIPIPTDISPFTISAIKQIIVRQFRSGYLINPPCQIMFQCHDRNGLFSTIRRIVDLSNDRSYFRRNHRFQDHLLFYARLYRVAIECICGRHADSKIHRLLLNFNNVPLGDFLLEYLCELDDAMVVVGVYI